MKFEAFLETQTSKEDFNKISPKFKNVKCNSHNFLMSSSSCSAYLNILTKIFQFKISSVKKLPFLVTFHLTASYCMSSSKLSNANHV